MNGHHILTVTNSAIDRVQLSLCMFLYEVCNDVQFEYMSGSDFVNFLNLKPTATPVVVRSRENLRICYLTYAISKTIAPKSEAERWTKGFLASCPLRMSITANIAETSPQSMRQVPTKSLRK